MYTNIVVMVSVPGVSAYIQVYTVQKPGLGFYRVERYFYHTMGKNMGKNGKNTFLPGRNLLNIPQVISIHRTNFHAMQAFN